MSSRLFLNSSRDRTIERSKANCFYEIHLVFRMHTFSILTVRMVETGSSKLKVLRTYRFVLNVFFFCIERLWQVAANTTKTPNAVQSQYRSDRFKNRYALFVWPSLCRMFVYRFRVILLVFYCRVLHYCLCRSHGAQYCGSTSVS